MKIAFLFPGQGSQTVGMAKDLVSTYSKYEKYLATAEKSLGFSISTLMFEGPMEDLTKTYNAQPALLLSSTIAASLLMEYGVQPDYLAGHSLGEYSALVMAGALSVKDGATIVHKRGKFMNEAVPAGQGAMAAILGMEPGPLEEVTDAITASGHPVQIANLNCPGQIVISGTAEGVRLASESAKENGAKRAIPLAVSGPFHSSLMRPASSKLAVELAMISVNTPKVPVIANVTAEPVMAAEPIRQLLIEQVTAPVRWEESVRKMIDLGVDTFIECGPGNVLSGLVKKIDRSVTTLSVHDSESLVKTIQFVKGVS
ncbi:[acyl-carrier-protein] S-malonyltransferase [Chryseomicrobium excrementi]|uniref:Malonyl CoA-acyl carrier protein transacylase n=1 Tax=Chryseomicrobium excrementi TaxID=2041346 RepID=A0A2M9F362_9BACL|nr:ACP S-malonyltransferase [Chryseomicrobium excrementi]PJK17903.1 [acyl-carrier-protein] S-malonyltransferase [Chryseomicrobium excrementi]